MSREIKFRVWDDVNQYYFYNVAIYPDNVVGVQRHNIESEMLKAEYGATHWTELGENVIIEQYTGLKDKNGKEIYEGDIVKYDCTGCNYIVVYRKYDASFVLENDDREEIVLFQYNRQNDYEVIGTIHENPELLEGEG